MQGTKRNDDCTGGGRAAPVEPNGREVGCDDCGRYFTLPATSRRVRDGGRVLPAHKRTRAAELAIDVVDVAAGLLGGAS